MNIFAANDLEAAGLLAPARLDDGAPPAVIPPPARDGQACRTGHLCGRR
jgi:hypothetical protein